MLPLSDRFAWRIDVRGRYLGQDCVNTFQYISSPAFEDYNQPSSVYTAFTDGSLSIYSLLLACMVDGYQSRVIIVSRESPRPSLRYSRYFPVSDPGGISEVGLPSQVSCVIIRRTNIGNGTNTRGRIFVGAVPGLYTAAGQIIDGSPLAVSLDDLAARMRGSITFRPVANILWLGEPAIVTSRRRLAPGQDYLWGGVALTNVRASLGTQRHRQPGHGRRG